MRELSIQRAINEALHEEMERDDTVFVMGEDVGKYGGHLEVTKDLFERFGAERAIDTPISEAAIAGSAVGAAIGGMRPVAEIQHIDFITIALDAIVNHAAVLPYAYSGQIRVPMVIRTQGGSYTVGAQHCKSLEAWLVHVPGLKVVMPSTPYDAKGLMKSAIRDPNPVVFIEHKMLYRTKGPVPAGEYAIPFGVADVKREGRHCTFVGINAMVAKGLQAAERLAKEGVELEVVDPRSLNPLDVDTIVESVKKTGRLVVGHEAYERGGIAGEIIAQVVDQAFDYLDAPPQRVCGKNCPIPYNARLETAALPQADDVVSAVLSIV